MIKYIITSIARWHLDRYCKLMSIATGKEISVADAISKMVKVK